MENQSNKWHVRLWKNAKHRLMKTSLEQLICFGVKSDLPQRQIMAVYAGYSLLGTLLLLMPISTTISALYAYTKNALEMRKEVSLRGNIIPHYRIASDLTTVLFYTFILFVGIYLIGLFEPDSADFLKISFEAVSALATAGLTSGILSDITLGSKAVLIILMYIGRVGVITFGNAMLAGREENIKGSKDMAV